MLTSIQKRLAKLIDAVGYMTAILMVWLILNVVWDVVMRYIFHNSSIAMQELEWHTFSVMMLYGTGYALRHDAHVRVDFIYDKLQIKKRAAINIFGAILFLIPLVLLVIYGSWDFVMDAYSTNEISEDPGGLTHRWIIKAQIPAAFVFLGLCSIEFIVRNIIILQTGKELEDTQEMAK